MLDINELQNLFSPIENAEFKGEFLNLQERELDDSDMVRLSKYLEQNKKNSQLKLNLSFNNISDSGAETLSKLTMLHSLDLCGNNLGPHGCVFLASSTAQEINISANDVGDNIGNLITSPSLTKLIASECNVGDIGAKKLFSSKKIKLLYLSNNNITDQALVDIDKNKIIENLDLSQNSLNGGCCLNIAKNESLLLLNLTSNFIGDEGVKFLATNSSIKTLILAQAFINNADQFATNKTIKTLILYNNNISNIGDILNNSSLTHLDLSSNPITQQMAELITQNYQENDDNVFTRTEEYIKELELEQHKKKLIDDSINKPQELIFLSRPMSAPERMQSIASEDMDNSFVNTSFSSNYSNTPSPKDSMGLGPIEEKKEPPIVPQFQLKRPKEIEKEDELISKPKRHSPNSQDSSSISSNDSLGVSNINLANDDTCYKTLVSTNNKQGL